MGIFGSRSGTPISPTPASTPPVESTSTALANVDARSPVLDTRPTHDPDRYATRPPAEAEMLAQLRERVAALESSAKALSDIPQRTTTLESTVGGHGTKIGTHTTEIDEVTGFHKTVKVVIAVIAALLTLLGGIAWFMFADIVSANIKMTREYTYCEEHRKDKDGADCIVAPPPKTIETKKDLLPSNSS